MLAGVPPETIEVPSAVLAYAAGRTLTPVWLNELGGLTFEIDGNTSRDFVKWNPRASSIDLSQEVERLRWAAAFTTVPEVIDQGSDANGQWFATRGLEGENAVAERWRASPGEAVVAIATGLRHLHDSLPIQQCPFSWQVEDRLADIARRGSELEPADWHPEFRDLSVADALALVLAVPEVDHLVVCHGDACAPNTLLDESSSWAGHVDMGSLGIADRWADLAIASWSLDWNYGSGWQDTFFDAYGIEADAERISYYRLLSELGP